MKKRIYRAAVSQRLRNNDVEFHSKNKFETFVHLVGFIVRNCDIYFYDINCAFVVYNKIQGY